MSAGIGVIGSNMVDLVTAVTRMPEPGETLMAGSFFMGAGGKGANQAAAAARLGSEVLMLSKLGDDLFGRNTLRNFQELGIDSRHVGVVQGVPSGVASIFVEPSGENRILIVPGANQHLRPADIDLAAADLLGCRLILLQLEIPLETVYHTIDFAVHHGLDLVLNPAPATPALEIGRLGGVGFLVPNQTELSILTGLPADTRAQAETAARSLIARGVRRVVVTLGAEGALLVAAEGARHIPPVAVTPVDTTGAGDAFIGSFAHFYLRLGDVGSALDWAARYAADSITRPGAQGSYADAAGFAVFCSRIGLPSPVPV